MVSKLAVECEQKNRTPRGQKPPLKALAGGDVRVCLPLSCGLAHIPLLKHSQSAECALALLLQSSLDPFFLVDLGGIRWSFLLGRGSTGLVRSEQLVPGLRFSALLAGKHAEKELHSLRCLPCASAKAPITMLVSWCS